MRCIGLIIALVKWGILKVSRLDILEVKSRVGVRVNKNTCVRRRRFEDLSYPKKHSTPEPTSLV